MTISSMNLQCNICNCISIFSILFLRARPVHVLWDLIKHMKRNKMILRLI